MPDLVRTLIQHAPDVSRTPPPQAIPKSHPPEAGLQDPAMDLGHERMQKLCSKHVGGWVYFC